MSDSPVEKNIELYGKRQAEAQGILVLKLKLIAGSGWPDHTFFKNGRVAFIEYKRDEKSPFQPLQPYYIKKLRQFGFLVDVCWTREQVDHSLQKFNNIYSS